MIAQIVYSNLYLVVDIIFKAFVVSCIIGLNIAIYNINKTIKIILDERKKERGR